VTCLQQALIAGGYSIPAGATGYFGAQTRAAVSAWQKAVGVSPTAGYFGAISRAHWNLGGGSSSSTSTTTTTTTTTTNGNGTVAIGSGNGLKVYLSPTSPNGSVLVEGQGIGDLGDFVFANPTASPINVTGLTFNRIGVSNDSSLTNVYLYNGVTRITDSAGVSNSQFSFSDPTALFTVQAGQTYTVSVRSDILSTASGQQIGVSLISATSNGTLDSSVSFPLNSGYQTVSAASLATVNYSSNPQPTGSPQISPQNDYPVWQDNISVSTNPVYLKSLKFTNIGSIDNSDIINLRLYIDGVQVGNAVPAMNSDRTITFDLSAAPALLSTQSHVVKVLANIIGGASLTFEFSVQRSADGMFVDSQLNQPVTPEYNSTTFSAVTTSTVTMTSVGATSGVSVSLSPTSPNQTVAVGASSVKWASFSMLASGENVKISDLYVYASSTLSSGAIDGVGGLANGKVYLNGVQVGSTHSLLPYSGGVPADFSLGSSLILPAGQTVTVDIYADAKTTANANLVTGDTVVVTLAAYAAGNAQGQTSLTATEVPASNTNGNSITVSSSTLTATKYSGYGNQTMIAGALNAKLGAFTLSTGSTEGVTVNTIAFSLGALNSGSITNVRLVDDSTGNQIGTAISTPNTTSNSYAVQLDIPVSSTKVIDIIGNILSGANAGTMQATLTTSTAGTGDLTGTSATAASTALQTITVSTGTLTATTGAGDPTSNNVLAGASSIQVGEFNFAATASAFTVQNLAILVPNGAATSVTNVTVSYKDVNGTTQTSTTALNVSSATSTPYATATFTGLTMYVPANDSSNIDVSVGTPTIASGAASGAPINISLDRGGAAGANATFRALNAAGSATTYVSTGAPLTSGGTFYVRKSIPTFAMLPAPSSNPSSGTALYRFSITADPAGAVEWSHIAFNLSTSTSSAYQVVLTNLYLTNEASGVSLLNSGKYATTTGSTAAINLLTDGVAKYQQIGAGQTVTYDLFGTVSDWTTGTSITISLAPDTSATTTSDATSVTNSPSNVVWSDRSASGHAVTTPDWTNGYLLKNFTSSATSYSK
jgi:hypothetical protein